MFKRLKSLWSRFCNWARRPSIESIAGLSTGSSTGRAVWYGALGVLALAAGQFGIATLALAVVVFEVFVAYHVFRCLAELYALRHGALRVVA